MTELRKEEGRIERLWQVFIREGAKSAVVYVKSKQLLYRGSEVEQPALGEAEDGGGTF